MIAAGYQVTTTTGRVVAVQRDGDTIQLYRDARGTFRLDLGEAESLKLALEALLAERVAET